MATQPEPQLPLFYKKIVPLNKEQHADLYVEPADNFKYTKDSNSIYIAAVEFPKACKEYPIVFGNGPNGAIYPVVLLGLKVKQNLYLGKKGEWLAQYVPAYVRRYPFILASSSPDSKNFAVCVDESFAGFNRNKKGQRLFTEKGQDSAMLKQAVDFLRDYQTQIQLTTLFCNNINKLGLFEPVQATIEKSGKKEVVGGFMCINRAKLKALAPDKAAELLKTDQMELIFAHLSSLSNMERLLKKSD